MSQKFSEPVRGQCDDRRLFAGENLASRWAGYSSRILPASWTGESLLTAEMLFYTGAATAFDLLVLKPGGRHDAASRRVLQDLQVWLKKRRKEFRGRSRV